MGDIAIRVDGIAKAYRIGVNEQRHETMVGAIAGFVKAPLSNFRNLRNLSRFDSLEGEDLFWALKDVSFEVKQGDVVGIIGQNGAGKSTLLKILSRITEPTRGAAYVHGRVGSLLEVGTGFHPDLTGRENVYLNGTILGMRKREIDAKFDQIVDFSGVEKFIDTPVKRYSSGMRVRLAFSVAAHLEPEILIVDEVLAVGDAEFQKRCLGKMGDVARQGRTVLFVSHNMSAVESLCNLAVLLENGRVLRRGVASEIVSAYLKSSTASQMEVSWPDDQKAPGNQFVRLHQVRVRPERGGVNDTIDIKTPIVFEFEYSNLVPGTCLDLSFHLFDEYGVLVCNPASFLEPKWHGKPLPVGRFRSVCFLPGDLLNDGAYTVQLIVNKDTAGVISKLPDILRFAVMDAPEMRGGYFGRWPGAIRPHLKWTTEFVEGIGATPR